MEQDISLEDIGWKVLQQRQVHIERLLIQALRAQHTAHGQVWLLDLAVGSGRQVLEVLRSLPELEIDAELRDANAGAFEAAQASASRLGLTRVRFRSGDAFDERALARSEFHPRVVLATGLFELTPETRKVEACLRGLHEAMAKGAQLIFTDQPQHPRLEMIGRVAVQRDESPWAMRRRSLEEIRALFPRCGFELKELLLDEHQLFAVGCAVKPL